MHKQAAELEQTEFSCIFETGWLSQRRLEYNQLFYPVWERKRFCFLTSCMEMRPSAVGEKPVCADLGLLFSFGLIHKENSWQLHSEHWRPRQWTACTMLSGRLWLVGKARCLLYQYLKSRLLHKNAFYNMLTVACRDNLDVTVAELGCDAETFLRRLNTSCSTSRRLQGI